MELLAQYGDDDELVPFAPSVNLAPAVNTAGLALVQSGGQSIVVPLASTKNLQGALEAMIRSVIWRATHRRFLLASPFFE